MPARMRWSVLSLLLLLCLAALGGWTDAVDTPPTIRIGVLQAPPALPILRMISSGAMADRAVIKIDVWSAPEQLIAMAQDGRHHMLALSLPVAARLHNKGVGIRLTNVNTWGISSVVTSVPEVKTWKDLKGKTLFVPAKSSTPDALTRYFLGRAGMSPGRDLEVIHSSVAEIGLLAKAGKIANAVLLEPHVTAAVMGNPELRIAWSFDDDWRKIEGAGAMIPNAGLAATTAFLDAHPGLVRQFEREYEKATDWVNEHPAEAGALAEKHLGLRAEIIAAAMPRLGLRYKSAGRAKEEVDWLFHLLLGFSPDMIGKKIPDESLYWR